MRQLISPAAFSKRAGGYLQDVPDARDKLIGALISGEGPINVAPPRRKPPTHGLGPMYQAGNSCTGRCVLGYQIGEVYHGREAPRFSASANYFQSRSFWGGQDRDQGSRPRDAMRAMAKYGLCLEQDWPENWFNINRAPSLKAMAKAFSLRGVHGYFRIPDGDVDAIRRVIAAEFCVGGGWAVGERFKNYKEGDGTLPKPNDVSAGMGHYWLIDGYEANGDAHGLNSWPGWGGNSYGPSRMLISEEFLAAGKDMWAIVTEEEGGNTWSFGSP